VALSFEKWLATVAVIGAIISAIVLSDWVQRLQQ